MSGSDRDWLDGIVDRGFLAQLPPELIEEVLDSALSVFYPEGASRDGAGVGLVVSGLLRYYLSAPDGRQVTIRYIAPGDLVGSLSVRPSDVNTHLQAVEPSVLLSLDTKRLQALATRRPELAQALAEELTSRLRQAFRALGARAFMSVQSRVARDLLERANAHGHALSGMHLNVTQQSLADATGSVREVVTRAIGTLHRSRVIAKDRTGITILDPAALARMAEPWGHRRPMSKPPHGRPPATAQEQRL